MMVVSGLAVVVFLMTFPLLAEIDTLDNVDDLEGIVNAAFTNSQMARVMPPGISYDNDLGVLGYASGFSSNFLNSLVSETNGLVVSYAVLITETNSAIRYRRYFNATNGLVHTTTVSIAGYPDDWIEEVYGEVPRWLTGDNIDEWCQERDPSRQRVRCLLISTSSVPDYLAGVTNAVPSWPGGGTNQNLLDLYSNSIAFVQIDNATAGTELYVHAPTNVAVVDIYESTNLLAVLGWTLPATVDFTTDPLLWLYTGPESSAFFAAGDPAVDTDGDGLGDSREKRLFGTSITLADTDGDGISDGLEILAYGMNALSIDTDGDGLLDGYEVQYALNPRVNNASEDPDGDGLTNLEEQALGTDPNNQADGVALLEAARARIVTSWYMVMTNDLAFTNTPGSAADLNDMKTALNQLSGKFYRVDTPFVGGSAVAQNFTNWPTYGTSPVTNWPSTNGYNSVVDSAAWAYGAIDERGEAMFSGSYNPSSLSGLKTHKAILESLKSDYLGDLMDDWEPYYWVRKDCATNGSFADYFAHSSRPTDLPMIDGVPAVAASANLPTNFLEYTPDRCLGGVGPLTNDASVGTGHGWTNSSTAAGGNTFPAGRSAWYTTDYGWPSLKSALQALAWTRNWGGGDGMQSCSILGPYCSTVAAAYSSNSAAWNNTTWYDYTPPHDVNFAVRTSCSTNLAGECRFYSYRAAYTNGDFWAFSGITTSRSHSAQLYVRLHGYGRTLYDFDGITIGGIRTNAAYHYVEECDAANTNARASSKPTKARTNPMTIKWPTAPGPEAAGEAYGMEEMYNWAPIWLFKWDCTNGFQYQ